MSDLVERLREYASDDHERGCQGRYYDCSCGYDDKRDPLMNEAADRIEQLEAALAMFVCDCTVSERCPVPDNCRNFKARRMLEDRT